MRLKQRIQVLEEERRAKALEALQGQLSQQESSQNPMGRRVHEDALGGSEDVLVAVDSDSTADYIGESRTNGVLQADETISYTDGGDFVTLGVDILNVGTQINNSVTITNILEHDPVFTNWFSVDFTNDVRAAQTNDGYEANTDDQTQSWDQATLTLTIEDGNSVVLTGILTNYTELDPVFLEWLGTNTYIKIENDPVFTNWVATNTYVQVEEDPIFTAYSNSAEFVADVQAAQTNDGFEANTDEMVSIDSAATPNYIGSTGSNGVIQVDETLTYSDLGDFIRLGTDLDVLESNVIATVSNTFDVAALPVDDPCNQNEHPGDDDYMDGDDGTTHPGDESDDGSTHPGGTDDDGSAHPGDDDCYSTVPDPVI